MSTYFSEACEPDSLRKVVNRTIKMIRMMDVKFDFIAFRGASGAMVAPIVALRMNKHCTAIRKPKDSSHSGGLVAGRRYGRYIIIDDFISSGDTVRDIIKTLFRAQCVGVACYADPAKRNRSPRQDEFPKFEEFPCYI